MVGSLKPCSAAWTKFSTASPVWLWTYNNERPNIALGDITPKKRIVEGINIEAHNGRARKHLCFLALAAHVTYVFSAMRLTRD